MFGFDPGVLVVCVVGCLVVLSIVRFDVLELFVVLHLSSRITSPFGDVGVLSHDEFACRQFTSDVIQPGAPGPPPFPLKPQACRFFGVIALS